jgi:signal peptidase II
LFAILFFSIDRIVKFLFLNYLPQDTILNKGIIFGIGYSMPIWFFLILLIAIVIWLTKDVDNGLGLSLIVGGGLSNVIDRILYNGVVDFQILKITAFNLADIFIIVGFLIVFYKIFSNSSANLK